MTDLAFSAQPSLLDGVAPLATPQRRELSRGAWVDLATSWWPEPDTAFRSLAAGAHWRAERRPMYDRVVDVPRLVAHYDQEDTWPCPELTRMCARLNEIYAAGLGEPLVSAGLCLYRDGRDSVAWHGDTIGRGRTHDTIVAILSLGATRTLALRPRGGGESLRFTIGHGDLLVMGGSCQRTWEHAIPKMSEPVGPRISVQFRPAGVR
ncbi:MAG: alpha-ketoglutarate-dependent dioxygenase AlkB [Actinomycetales bacterium]